MGICVWGSSRIPRFLAFRYEGTITLHSPIKSSFLSGIQLIKASLRLLLFDSFMVYFCLSVCFFPVVTMEVIGLLHTFT